jgi:hypothetical protein
MNRVLKRPMFRMGGSSGTGITSGLDTPKRGLVDGPGKYSQPDFFSLIPTKSEFEQAKEMFPQFKSPPSQAINRLLISGGLDLISRPPQGGTLATAAAAFKEPTKQLFEDIDTEKATKFATDADLFKTLVEAKGEALSGIGDSKTYSQLEIGKQIQSDILKIADLQNKLQDKTLTEEKRKELDLDLKATQANLNFLRKSNPVVDNLLANKTLSEGFINSIMLELSADKQKYPRGLSDTKLYEDAVKIFNQRLQSLTAESGAQRTSEAEGGRIGYQMGGGANMGQMSATEEPKIDYATLRARLPKEISDDVVKLISASPEALEDFATIATQSDVDMFNQKYSVNLTLPQEA